ncbi:hypothetical protein EC991_010400 [Linnemannia zychae]|nr:hypothetical protein EC991_010400 [Linnemannia zychae]
MADHHPDHSSQAYSVQRQSQLHTQFRQQQQQQQQHQHLQVPHTQRIYRQDTQGPYSAGVIEDRRAFPSFRGSGSNISNNNGNSNSGRMGLHQLSSSSSRGSSSSSRGLSISDILERFSASPEEFVITVLNAKAKEDELKTEEERYKTEVLKLQSRQLDISLAMEKRRKSPPAGRSYATSTAESGLAMHAPPGGNFRHGYSAYPTPAQPDKSSDSSNTRSHYAASGHQDTHEQQHRHQTAHDQADVPLSPTRRPSPPMIDTVARHSSSRQQQLQQLQQQQHQQAVAFQQQQLIQQHQLKKQQGQQRQQLQVSTSSSQRKPPSPSTTQSPVSGKPSASISGRHHPLHPLRTASAQSSPVTNVDMQSQIPRPLSPDEYASPTSATPSGSGLKRKSINHDEVMDAIRAKVLRNAASGLSQQQKEQREKPHRKPSGELTARRKPHPLNSSNNNNDGLESPSDRSKRPATAATMAALETPSTPQRALPNTDKDTAAPASAERPSPAKKEDSTSTYNYRMSKQDDADEPLMSPHPITRSPPASMSPPSSASRSNSSSPRMEAAKYMYQRQYQRQEERRSRNDHLSASSDRGRERPRAEPIAYSEDDRKSRYSMEHSRAERPSEVGDIPPRKTESRLSPREP